MDEPPEPAASAEPPDEATQASDPRGGSRSLDEEDVGTPSPVPTPGASSPTHQDPLIGKVLDHRYRIVQLLAKGGMGRVYRAEQAPLNRLVAVKVLELSSEGSQDAEFRDRFTREAAACARLTHPNTIRIFDYGRTWDDVHYIAMEFLEGRNLHQAIRSDAPMPASRVIPLCMQVCGSLKEAHDKGLIHRDLKPSNVMLLSDGDEAEFVKVLDFGLVKELRADSELTRADAVVGSPSYMSPEQIRAGKVDQRSDIYALGVLMTACLTGRTPFSGQSSVNVLMAHLQSPAPSLRELSAQCDAGPVLEWIVRTCLAKTPDERFASVEELRRALQLAAAEADGQAVAVPGLRDGKMVGEDGAPTPSALRRPPPRVSPTPFPAPPPGNVSPPPPPSPSSSRIDAPPVFADPPPRRASAGAFPWAVALAVVVVSVMALLAMMVWVATHAPPGWPPPATTKETTARPAAPAPADEPAAASAPAVTDSVEPTPAATPPAAPPAATSPPRTPARPPPPRAQGKGASGPPASSPPANATPASGASPSGTPPNGTPASGTTAATPSAAPASGASTPPADPSHPSDLRDPWKK